MDFPGKNSNQGRLQRGLGVLTLSLVAALVGGCSSESAASEGSEGDAFEAGAPLTTSSISATSATAGSSGSSASSGSSKATGSGSHHGSSANDAGSTNDGGPSESGSSETESDAGASSSASTALFPKFLMGTNLSGAEFGSALPGVYGSDYTFPTHAEIDTFTAKGMTIFRFPFMWERLQPTLDGAFDTTYLGRLTDIVNYATSKGARAILNPQNFARYRGLVVGSGGSAATSANFADFWSRLSTVFLSNPNVVFGLMNEPNTMATELWLTDANAAIAGIRKTGATNVIFVPGNGWTGAHDWTDGTQYGTANSVVMLGVVDPLNRYAYEVHQYNDSDSSGSSAICTTPDGSARLTEFTAWLKANHKVGFLGEFAASTDASCNGVIDSVTTYLEANEDVWLGWTWWSAGPWWPAGYPFTIEPTSTGADQPQMTILEKYL